MTAMIGSGLSDDLRRNHCYAGIAMRVAIADFVVRKSRQIASISRCGTYNKSTTCTAFAR